MRAEFAGCSSVRFKVRIQMRCHSCLWRDRRCSQRTRGTQPHAEGLACVECQKPDRSDLLIGGRNSEEHGKRWLTHHGDAALRTTLFLGAMAACKRVEWRAVYEANIHKGLPSTAALVVVARKLARVAFGLFKSGETYEPGRFLSRSR